MTGAQVRAPARSCIRPAFPAQPYLAAPPVTPHFPPLPSFPPLHPVLPAELPAAGRGLGAAGCLAGPLPADPGSAQIGNPAGTEAWEQRLSSPQGLAALGFGLRVTSASQASLGKAGMSWEKPREGHGDHHEGPMVDTHHLNVPFTTRGFWHLNEPLSHWEWWEERASQQEDADQCHARPLA